jgi:predicted 3-demethylubiquinone-9 3-methyltransferase (glyoxalase superfamily)
MQKITPFLWFDKEAEEAANFYVSLFKNSKINSVSRYGDAGPGPKGSVMIVNFELDGQHFTALNGGPHYKFTPAISLFVNCETQQEVDQLWEKLSAGGRKDRCGWLQDKYGLSWQIIPSALSRLMSDPDRQKSARVMQKISRRNAGHAADGQDRHSASGAGGAAGMNGVRDFALFYSNELSIPPIPHPTN